MRPVTQSPAGAGHNSPRDRGAAPLRRVVRRRPCPAVRGRTDPRQPPGRSLAANGRRLPSPQPQSLVRHAGGYGRLQVPARPAKGLRQPPRSAGRRASGRAPRLLADPHPARGSLRQHLRVGSGRPDRGRPRDPGNTARPRDLGCVRAAGADSLVHARRHHRDGRSGHSGGPSGGPSPTSGDPAAHSAGPARGSRPDRGRCVPSQVAHP